MKEFLMIFVLYGAGWSEKFEIGFDTLGACNAAKQHIIASWNVRKEAQPICISRK